MSKVWKLKGLFQETGWMSPCFIKTNAHGIIESIAENLPDGATNVEVINGYALPGFQNAHSHSFQYAMSGLAEIHRDPLSKDDFWSWRDTMYNIALSMSPDQFEAIATMLYSEMLSHGYTHVAEFHYVHHDKGGMPYDNLAEMGERLVAAADHAGIGITLVPIFYQKGGFGKAPGEKQRRFISKTAAQYLQLLEESKKAANTYDHANVAMGIHSLRAVDQASITAALDASLNLPVHIHIAEQLMEIEDCESFYGQRPVAWMLDNYELNDNFHLVHATHINSSEIEGIVKSKANVVLCPSTEGNLGDGIFPLQAFQEIGGKWSIGTDSNIGLNPFEELRILDYGQRLISHRRNQFVSREQGDSGEYGLKMALTTGRKAMGNNETSHFAVGQSFDAVILDAKSPLLATSELKNILSTAIYSGDRSMIQGVICHGDWRVKEGRHLQKEEIVNAFASTMQALKIR
jgi:formimidoylglutamate deiminase